MKTSSRLINPVANVTCSLCGEKQRAALKSNKGPCICVRCLNQVSESAGVRPHNSIYCFRCKTHREGVRISYNGGTSVDAAWVSDSGDPDAPEAVYAIRNIRGNWSAKEVPSNFSCLKCGSVMPYWMVYNNDYMTSWLPPVKKV